MADFNAYVEWLGLPAEVVEPNHYQLLGLPDYEGDAGKIGIAADKAMSRVRGFRPGPNARAWSKLLDELLLAKGRLLDIERKGEYDAELRELGSVAKTEAPAAAAPAATTSSAGWDPRFPPGMGPNVGKSPPPTKAEEIVQLEAVPAPPAAAVKPAPVNPAPLAAAPVAGAPVAGAPVAVSPGIPTAWPSSMMHPVANAPVAAPAQPVAQQPYAQPAPLAQPMYPQQQPYGAPVAGYGQPLPAYPGAQPYQQPQYGQPAYGQPPYGAPGYPPAQPAYPQYPAANYAPAAPVQAAMEPPVNYNFGQFQPAGLMPGVPGSMPVGGSAGYGATAHSSYALGDAASGMALDPMAPVSLPTPAADDGKQARVVGFAAHQQAASTAAIPRGKAVSSAPAAASSPPANAPAVGTAAAAAMTAAPPMPTPPLMSNSADSPLASAYSGSGKSDPTLLYVTGGGVLLLACAIIFAVINANSGSTEVAQNPEVPPQPVAPATVDPGKTDPGKTKITPKPIEPAVSKPPVVKPADKPKPIDPKPIEPKPIEPMPPMNDPFGDPPGGTKPEMQPETKPLEPKPVEPKPVEPKPTEPKPPEPMTIPVVPKPADPPAPTEMKLSPADLAALSAALNGAKEALRERNFDEADKQLAAAQKLAQTDEQKAKFMRLDMLSKYVKQFDRSMKTLMADENFDAGSELTVGKGTRVVVVERSPSNIVIRINGVNKSYTLANLPDGLAMSLIDLRLPVSDPVSKVIKGAHLAAAKVPTDENQAKAKELFAEAVQGGVSEAADLALVMTDTYDFKE